MYESKYKSILNSIFIKTKQSNIVVNCNELDIFKLMTFPYHLTCSSKCRELTVLLFIIESVSSVQYYKIFSFF